MMNVFLLHKTIFINKNIFSKYIISLMQKYFVHVKNSIRKQTISTPI